MSASPGVMRNEFKRSAGVSIQASFSVAVAIQIVEGIRSRNIADGTQHGLGCSGTACAAESDVQMAIEE